LGKRDEALAAVQKACKERDGGLLFLNYVHDWDPLRSDGLPGPPSSFSLPRSATPH
jgi:hypothetical protein